MRVARADVGARQPLCQDPCMGNYAIVNLMKIDDGVQGRVEGLEGRFGRNPLG